MELVSIERNDVSAIAWCPVTDKSSINLDNDNKTEYNPIYFLASVNTDIDKHFVSTSRIEILNTSPSSYLSNNNRHKNTLQSLGSCISKLNFTELSWGQQSNQTDSSPLGLIAGGMDDGTVTFWNPYNIISKNNNKKPLIGKEHHHQSKITAMQFNPTISKNTYLVTASEEEKLFVWDLTKISKPIAQQPPGHKKQASSSYPKYATAVAWNNNVSYILAVSNKIGQTQIYDLRGKKIALTFECKNLACAQSISWNPNKARQLAVCYRNHEAEIWDLKQPRRPKFYLRNDKFGHKINTSINDLSWNYCDNNVLMTSGDDGIGNIWNGQNGKFIHQIQFNANHNHSSYTDNNSSNNDNDDDDDDDDEQNNSKLQIEWNNQRGGLLATRSGGDISLYNINYFGDNYCPKWLKKPCGVHIGFGGKICAFKTEYILSASQSSSNLANTAAATPSSKTKKKVKIPPMIDINYLPKSQTMIERANAFKKTLNTVSNQNNNINDLIKWLNVKIQTLNNIKLNIIQNQKQKDDNKSKINKDKDDKDKQKSTNDILDDLGISDLSDSDTDDDHDDDNDDNDNKDNDNKINTDAYDVSEIEYEIEIWSMIRLFFNENPRDNIIEYLGFEKQELIKQKNEIIKQQQQQQQKEQMQSQQPGLNVNTRRKSNPIKFGSDHEDDDGSNQPQSVPTRDESDHDNDYNSSESDNEDFFNNLGGDDKDGAIATPIKPNKNIKQKPVIKDDKKDDKKDESSIEQAIQKNNNIVKIKKISYNIPTKINNDVRNCIITGNWRLAIDLSIKSNNIADALVFAYYSNKRDELWKYASDIYFKQTKQQFIATTFKHIINNDFDKLVATSNLSKWKETLAILLTFTSDLDGNVFNNLCNKLGFRLFEETYNLFGSITCFLCSYNIQQLISLWTIQSTNKNKKPTDLVLYKCITKALIYVNSPFIMNELNLNRKLYINGQTALSTIYCKYANLLANQGSLDIANTFLQCITSLRSISGSNNINDKQINELINRINVSQSNSVASASTYNTKQNKSNNNNNKQARNNNNSQRPPKPSNRPNRPNRPSRRGGRGGNRDRGRGRQRGSGGSSVDRRNSPRNLQNSEPIANTPPIRQSPRGRGRGRITRGRDNRPIRGNRPTRGRGRGNASPKMKKSQSQSQSPSPRNNDNNVAPRNRGSRGRRGMPSTGGNTNRGRGRGNPRVRGRGARRLPPSTQPIQQIDPQTTQQTHQTHQTHQSGMNGRVPPPPNNNVPPRRGIRGRGTRVRGRGGRIPPPVQQQPIQQIQQPIQQQIPQQIQQQAPPRRNVRGRRGSNRNRGRGRGNRVSSGRGGNRQSPVQPHQIQQSKQNDNNIIDKPISNKVDGYSAAAVSSGSGFFGETALVDGSGSLNSLPSNALDLLHSIKQYLENIISDNSNIIYSLSSSDRKTITTVWSNKLEPELTNLINNNKMSIYAYSSLKEIFNSLQSRQYDTSYKQLTKITKNSKEFKVNRKWLMPFKSIITIAKRYNI